MRTPTISPTRGRATWNFVRHYLEMIIAMLVGMIAIGPVWTLLWPELTARADVGALVMATDMSLGMAAWMRVRRHSWTPIAEMTAAMYLPFVLLLAPFWSGWISGEALMTGGHVLMLPAMALAMLRRRRDYVG